MWQHTGSQRQTQPSLRLLNLYFFSAAALHQCHSHTEPPLQPRLVHLQALHHQAQPPLLLA